MKELIKKLYPIAKEFESGVPVVILSKKIEKFFPVKGCQVKSIVKIMKEIYEISGIDFIEYEIEPCYEHDCYICYASMFRYVIDIYEKKYKKVKVV